MKLQLLPLLLACILITSSCEKTVQPKAVQKEQVPIQSLSGKEISHEEMDVFLAGMMDSLNVKGLTISIINDGEVVYHRPLGLANVYAEEPLTESTLFEAASLSKPVFGFFTMKQVEKGLLDLDTPLYKYLPYPDIEHDARYKKITARMALSHRTGFPNWRGDNQLEIMFEPGTKFSYSGEGYMYLSKVLAKLNEVTVYELDSIFQEEIVKPMGLKHFYFNMRPYVAQHLSAAHMGDKVVFSSSWDRYELGAAGGLYTESKNYAEFLIGLMEGKVLKSESIAELLREQSVIPQDNGMRESGITGYGLGYGRMPDEQGLLYIHSGNNWGFTNFFAISPEKKWGIVVMTNGDQVNELDLRLEEILK